MLISFFYLINCQIPETFKLIKLKNLVKKQDKINEEVKVEENEVENNDENQNSNLNSDVS